MRMIKYFDLEQATLATHDGWRDVLPGRRPMLGAQQNFARDCRLGHRPTGIDVKHLQNRKSWACLDVGLHLEDDARSDWLLPGEHGHNDDGANQDGRSHGADCPT